MQTTKTSLTNQIHTFAKKNIDIDLKGKNLIKKKLLECLNNCFCEISNQAKKKRDMQKKKEEKQENTK